MRPQRMRGRACIVAVVIVAALGGCTAQGGGESRTDLAVYASVPLSGPAGAGGRSIRDGAELALKTEDDWGALHSFRVLDDATDGGAWNPVTVGENARRATSDSATVAYIGDLASGATRTSLPITNEAALLQVSPASTAGDLVSPFPGSKEVPKHVQPSGRRTFGRVIPDDEAQAEAGAAWAKDLGVRAALAM